ncbi:MAG: ABC transporter ATP-binding protein [Candidatus Thiodiazotropha sp. 6PDIVS]
MIETKNLSVGYKETLVEHISISLSSGDLLVIQGKNGSGKTCLLKTLAGIIPPKSGTISTNGKKPILITPFAGLYENMSFREIATYLKDIAIVRHDIFDSRVSLINKLVDSESLNKKCKYLSGGDRRIISVAIAFLVSGGLILLDEPIENLSEKNVANILTLVQHIKDIGCTIVIVDHRNQFISKATHILKINNKELVDPLTSNEDKTKKITTNLHSLSYN